jgi:hypothetical protein
MITPLGKLEKLYIVPYSKPDYSLRHIAGPPFFALINPESYTCKYRVEFTESQEPGTSGTSLKFNKMPPQEFNFDFLFDSTDIIQSIFPVSLSVRQQLEIFKHNILEYKGDLHRPFYLKIHWGSLLFKGVLTSMDVEFKLFSHDGSPLRAIAKCSFKESIEEELRLAKENKKSPDITHQRRIKESDKLTLMTRDIYEDQQYYLDIAAFNRVDSFRKIETGTTLFFPPIEK